MFEDLVESGCEISPDAEDRTIVYAIWSRDDNGTLTAEEAWAILHERYPDDPRFLLLNAYEELTAPTVSGAWTPGYFLTKVERIVTSSGGTLEAQLRDLLAYGGAALGGAKDDDARRLADVRARIGADGGEAKRDERAGLRLRRFEREVLRELHDRTSEGKPLGNRAASAAGSAESDCDWASAVASGKPRRPYAATNRFDRGELVEHTKFGVGVVTGVEPGRVHILFEGGTRKLLAG